MKWFMFKLLLLIVVWVPLGHAFAEQDHSGGTNSLRTRPVAGTSSSARLFELTSACLNGRNAGILGNSGIGSGIGAGTGFFPQQPVDPGTGANDGINIAGNNPGGDFTGAVLPPEGAGNGALQDPGSSVLDEGDKGASNIASGGNANRGQGLATQKCNSCHGPKDPKRSLEVLAGVNVPEPMRSANVIPKLSANEKADLAAFFKSQ